MTSWLEISERRLTGNYRALRAAAGGETAVMAVIKANAYGHGAAVCAPMLVGAGAEWLGATNAAEGAAVRRASGEEARILVMSGFLPEDVAVLTEHDLTPVVWTSCQVEWLRGVETGIHVEIDTGMSRQGVRPGTELENLLRLLRTRPELRLDGVFTHFCSAEEPPSVLTLTQERRFEQAIAQVAAAGLSPAWVHAGNTSSVDNPADANGRSGRWLEQLAGSVGARAMVRTGIGLYGYCLLSDRSVVARSLEPVMTWKTRVLSVRELTAGDTVGYNATFAAERAMRVALLPVGYANGLRRELSSGNRAAGWVMIGGHRAPILGRVSMNLTVVEIGEEQRVEPGDEAVILGDGITAEDHARVAGTIAYEILCGVQAGSICAHPTRPLTS